MTELPRTVSCAPTVATIDSDCISPTSTANILNDQPYNPILSLQKSLNATRDMLIDIRANGPVAQTDSRIGRLITQARELGSKTFWDNDVFEGVTKRGGWRLNILAQDSFLCGFIVYKADLEREIVEVQYLAVNPTLRGQGCGAKLVRWVQNWAQNSLTRTQVSYVACACVPEALGFYQRLGFKRLKEIKPVNDEEAAVLINGQFHMQWKLRPTRNRH